MRLALTLAAALAAASPLTLASAAKAEGLTNMTEAERNAFNAAVRDYLIANPEVIVEAMTELQAREERNAANRDLQVLAENKAAIYDNPNDWVGGNLEGDITIVEFMDYRCGYCHKAFAEIEELVASDGNIRFVLKEFPVLGEQSMLAAKYAVATKIVAGNDGYKKLHDALFAMRGDMSQTSLDRIATDLGLDAKAISAKLESPEVQAVIEENYRLANAMEINGTPTFVVGDTMVRGYVPLDGMRQILAAEREG